MPNSPLHAIRNRTRRRRGIGIDVMIILVAVLMLDTTFIVPACCSAVAEEYPVQAAHPSLSPDTLALLGFKSAVVSDPDGLLSGWSPPSGPRYVSPCDWRGVSCDTTSSLSPSHVVSLNLPGKTGSPFACKEGSEIGGGGSFCFEFPTCPVRRSSSGGAASEAQSFRGLPRNISVSHPSAPSCRGLRHSGSVRGSLGGVLSPDIALLSRLEVLSLPFHRFSGTIPPGIFSSLRSLRVLDLTGNHLSGPIPDNGFRQFANLEFLSLGYNRFEGAVPPGLALCGHLQVLNLAGNELTGGIPKFLGNLSALHILSLAHNGLSGTIPASLSQSCIGLEHLDLAGNFLTGMIPVGFGNCSCMRSLLLFSNMLSGALPCDLGQLPGLTTLDVSRNSLNGQIPPELANCTQLSTLVLTSPLDTESCIDRRIATAVNENTNSDKAENNYFAGGLTPTLARSPNIRLVWAPAAGLGGSLPMDWGLCKSLVALNLGGNSFAGKIPTGLALCKNLVYLDLSSNTLSGLIPPQLPVSCMLNFNVSGNVLSGLPMLQNTGCSVTINSKSLFNTAFDEQNYNTTFVDFPSLYLRSFYCGSVKSSLLVWFQPQQLTVIHDLSANNLTGPISGHLLGSDLVVKSPLYALILSDNQLTDTIPVALFSACSSVAGLFLDLSRNRFTGQLPYASMAACASLKHFDASSNPFTRGALFGSIPALKSLQFLGLASSGVTGRIAPQIGQLQGLVYLILGNNNLSGVIPEELGGMTSLAVMDLSRNSLVGAIPATISKLARLEALLLNNNSLSGSIPPSFSDLKSLVQIDLSFNNLSGEVPKRIGHLASLCRFFFGNRFLLGCWLQSSSPLLPPSPEAALQSNTTRTNSGGAFHLPSAIVITAIVTTIAIAIAIVITLAMYYLWGKVPSPSPEKRRDLIMFQSSGLSNLSFESVIRGTCNFIVDHLIGSGGFGPTYRAELMPGVSVAVKRLLIGRFQGVKQFDAEIRTLGRIRHRNLVTLLGYHSSSAEMFLVYNYLPGGNLERLIHESSRGLDIIPWKVRHRIALDIAEVLDYLHNDCALRVLHRDIKPSNILLDNSLRAYLSDFGLARLLENSQSHATTDVAGTYGYVTPEYAVTSRVSDKADVYSYGVVLMELLSGKRALDTSFKHCRNGFCIVDWAFQKLEQGQESEFFVPMLWEKGPRSELVRALHLAKQCTLLDPRDRPLMRYVVRYLKRIKTSALL